MDQSEDRTAAESTAAPPERRSFFEEAAALTFVGGLAAGYGTLGLYAGKYLFSTSSNRGWLFVSDVASLAPGQSLAFESPGGVKVTVTRREPSAASKGDDKITADDFIALSSVCPHLGCRVHWEPQNKRYFCPCHNGAFDPEGQPTSGPPKAENQQLPRYPLMVENGLLFIEMPLGTVGRNA